MPTVHARAAAVPAVSGSSGKLVLCHRAPAGESSWPGQAFARPDLTYTAAMDQFVASRTAKLAAPPSVGAGGSGPNQAKAQRQAWRSAWQRLQADRREERIRRQLTDQHWQEVRHAHDQAVAEVGVDRRAGRAGWKIRAGGIKAAWRAAWAERHAEFARRRQVDAGWRSQRQDLGRRNGDHAVGANWLAILVVVDNCTRQALGLPLFTTGVHVTADLLVAALRTLLPAELAYFIADGGAHFVASALTQLAHERGFVRVPLAPYRPQSNGIAERFIQTLKTWLAVQNWQTPEEVMALLEEFRADYNDRPHQGAELAGLSPNEYAARKAVL